MFKCPKRLIRAVVLHINGGSIGRGGADFFWKSASEVTLERRSKVLDKEAMSFS